MPDLVSLESNGIKIELQWNTKQSGTFGTLHRGRVVCELASGLRSIGITDLNY